MALSHFHPATARWFAEAFGAPTPAQEGGWASIRDRRATLSAAPTGSGKTLAACLTALDDLLQEGLRSPLPDEVRVVRPAAAGRRQRLRGPIGTLTPVRSPATD